MRYQQLFWDFDGTLVNTYPGMVQAFGDALIACGVNDFEIDEEEIYRTMRQHSLGRAYQRFTAEFQVDRDRLTKIYEQLAAPLLAQTAAFAGAADLLAAVTAAGGRNFLLTHRDHRALDRLAALDLAQYFSGAVTKDDDYPRKPDPTSLGPLSAIRGGQAHGNHDWRSKPGCRGRSPGWHGRRAVRSGTSDCRREPAGGPSDAIGRFTGVVSGEIGSPRAELILFVSYK